MAVPAQTLKLAPIFVTLGADCPERDVLEGDAVLDGTWYAGTSDCLFSSGLQALRELHSIVFLPSPQEALMRSALREDRVPSKEELWLATTQADWLVLQGAQALIWWPSKDSLDWKATSILINSDRLTPYAPVTAHRSGHFVRAATYNYMKEHYGI